jgi:hypothetical protein
VSVGAQGSSIPPSAATTALKAGTQAPASGRRAGPGRRTRVSGVSGLPLTLAAGLAAALPVILATIEALRVGWVPVADRGIIATRAHDVLSGHTPLVGQYTLAGEVTGHVTHSLGPMLFWLLALPAHFGSTVGMTLTMGAVNTLAIVGCVVLARRRGGRALMVMTALAIALMCQSLAKETFHDVWNPSAGLFPFTLLIFLCWSVACGEYRLLPLAVLVGSFAVQAHLTYLPPTLGLFAVALGGLTLRAIARRRRGAGGLRRRGLLLWCAAVVLVAGVCWSATIVGQLSEHPGNLTLVIDTASKPKATLGSEVGWHAVVRAVGVAPWWLRTPKTRWERKHEVRAVPDALATVSCIALLAAIGIVALAGLLRRRGDLTALALIAFALCLGLAAVAASTPTPRVLSATLGYTLWWGSQAGMCVWLTLIWALWLVLAGGVLRLAESVRGHRLAARLRRPGALASLALSSIGVAATAAVGGAVAAQGKHDEHAVTYRPIREIDAHLKRLVPPGGSVLLEGKLDGSTMPVKPAVRYFLVARGVRTLAPGSSLRLGTWYDLDGRPYKSAIYLSDVPRPPVERVRLVYRVGFRDGSGRHEVFVWMGHGSSGSAATPRPS